MPLEAPSFWYREGSVLGTALAPLGRLYGRIAEARAARITPYRSRLPVICVDWAGPQELLTTDEAIMIPPDGDEAVVAALAAAMDRLGQDGAFADQLAGQARTKAMALGFRWRDLLGRWQDVYRRARRSPTTTP